MPDGRVNNGGARPGAGRRPKADELKKISMMDQIAKPEEAWRAVCAKCRLGDIHALRIWIEHRFGKPKERVDVTSGDEPVRKFDLSKLNKTQLEALLAIHDADSGDTE